MSKGKQAVKQAAVTRAIKGAVKAGLPPTRSEIDLKTGNIVLFFGPPEATEEQSNPWDSVK